MQNYQVLIGKLLQTNKARHLLIENELKKLKTFDLGYLIRKSRFDEDGAQNYLVISTSFRVFYTEKQLDCKMEV